MADYRDLAGNPLETGSYVVYKKGTDDLRVYRCNTAGPRLRLFDTEDGKTPCCMPTKKKVMEYTAKFKKDHSGYTFDPQDPFRMPSEYSDDDSETYSEDAETVRISRAELQQLRDMFERALRIVDAAE